MKNYVIKFKDDFTKDKEKHKEKIEKYKGKYKGQVLHSKYTLIEADEQSIADIRKLAEVEFIQEDVIHKLCAQTVEYSIKVTRTQEAAHNFGYKGDGITVAFIDTGVNYTHEDLPAVHKGCLVSENIIVSVDVPLDYKDNLFHGSRTAGACFMQDNALGYLGSAPNAKMMIIKATNDGNASGTTLGTSIQWAVDNGADVINLSFSTDITDVVERDACQYAYDHNVSVVYAAGNDGAKLDSVFPINELTATERVSMTKNYKGVIIVGGIESDITQPYGVKRYASSSYGQGIDFCAPARMYAPAHNNNAGYVTSAGTSLACAYLAGVVALIRQRYPGITVDEIYNVLVKNCVSILGGDPRYYGNGMILLSDFRKKANIMRRGLKFF